MSKTFQIVLTGKFALTFIHQTVYVVHEVGQFETVQEAKNAAGIGKDFTKWEEGTPNHWTGWTDLGFYYTISPGTKRIPMTGHDWDKRKHETDEEQKRQSTLFWRRQMEAE